MSNNGKICLLVQECAVDNCQPQNLKVLLSVKKHFCQALLLFAALELQHFCLTWYVTALVPPHLLKLWLRCLPLHVLGSSSLSAHHLTVLFVCNTVLLQSAPGQVILLWQDMQAWAFLKLSNTVAIGFGEKI